MNDLAVASVTKSFGTTPVLRDVSLEIASGELFFLLGPSGCGKTTLLRIIAGFIGADAGDVRLGNGSIAGLPPEKREMAMVFQSYALWPHMTVLDNVAFGLQIRGVAAAERDRRAREALAGVGLEGLADRRPPALSGGQQQRVALARALVVRPRVLLLDEPLSNLDAKLRVSMRSEIRRICKDHELTAIYVTHDQKEALSMADRIALLDGGIVQQVGAPRDVYRRPANRFVADFTGAGNFLTGTVSDRSNGAVTLDTPLGSLRSTAFEYLPERCHSALAVLRPECVHPARGADDNVFEAVLTEAVFLGDMGQWTLAVGEHELTVTEINPFPRQAGETVRFRVDPADVVLLPDDGAVR